MPKKRALEKKYFYDFKNYNDIVNRALCKKNIIFYEKIKKLGKIIILIMFFVIEPFLTVASYQFFKNVSIWINHGLTIHLTHFFNPIKGPCTKCTENGLIIKNSKKIFFLYFRTCKLKIGKKNVREMDSF